jgi:hypothetical protein
LRDQIECDFAGRIAQRRFCRRVMSGQSLAAKFIAKASLNSPARASAMAVSIGVRRHYESVERM